jgi:hypothetical protein
MEKKNQKQTKIITVTGLLLLFGCMYLSVIQEISWRLTLIINRK